MKIHCGLMCEKDSECAGQGTYSGCLHAVTKCPSWELVILKSLILFQLLRAQTQGTS